MRRRAIVRKAVPYVLVAPLVVLLLILFSGLVTGFLQSLGYMPGFGVYEFTLDHYADVFANSNLVNSILLSVWVSILSALITAVIGVLLAWCLVTAFKARGIIVNLSKLPMLVPYSVCALLVIFLASQSGFLPRLLEAIGIENASDLFSKILYWPNSIGVILVFVFHASSFFAYMVMTPMSQVSSSLGEAAENLGASRWQTFIRVILPHCMPTVRSTFILIFVIFFGSYEVPLLVGSALAKFVSVQAYLDYINFNFISYRPEAMVLNMVMLFIAAVIALAVHLWDRADRKKRGVM